MNEAPDSRRSAWVTLGISLLVCWGVWHWTNAILIPANTAAAAATQRPIGNNSDLYPRWLGSRNALLYRRNPYSEEVTREIQIGFYGRPLDPHKPGDPTAEESFVYPLHVVFLLAPTVRLPFTIVQAAFRWIVLLAIASSLPLWMCAVGLRGRLLPVLAGMILVIGSYPAVLEFHQQNMAALAIFFVAAASASIVRNWQLVGGVFLALATIKPEVSWLTVCWLLGWAISEYSSRARLLWSFLASMFVLIGGSELLLPGWIGWFIAALRAYPAYGVDPNIFQIFLPTWLATMAVLTVLALFLVVCWASRKTSAGTTEFGWSLGWAGIVTLAVVPKQAAYNHLLLIPPLLLLFFDHKSSALFPRALRKAAFGCQIWQWTAALTLSLASVLVPTRLLLRASLWPLLTYIALVPCTLLAVMLATFIRSARSSQIASG